MIYTIKHLLRVGKNTPINDGLIQEKRRETDALFGADLTKKVVIRPDGDWTGFLPTPERQSGRTIETMSCVSFSLINCIEIIFKAKYGLDVNYSDRYLAKMSNTTRSGNSMSNVIDTARKISGLVDEKLWPADLDTMNWDAYFSSIPKSIIVEGQKWIPAHKLTFSVVPQNSKLIDQALEYSPLWVCGYAWYIEKGLYRSYGKSNHAFTLVKKSTADYRLALDQYEEFIKKLANDYLFGAIYNIGLEILDLTQVEREKLMAKGYSYIMRVQDKGQIYRLSDGAQISISDLDNDLIEKMPDISKETSTTVAKFLFDKKVMVPVSEELYNKIK